MTWKKITKLIPFPPGSGSAAEEPWTFPYAINERFVESPRVGAVEDTELKSERPDLSLKPTTWTRRLPHQHQGEMNDNEYWSHLIDYHGLGVSHLNAINFDHPETGKVMHGLITH